MDKLEHYLENNNIINIHYFYNNYLKFGYDSYDDLYLDLELLLNTIYSHVKVYDIKPTRLNNQIEFRNKLIKKYNKCVVSDNDCVDELEAAHIIPYSECNNFDIYNGLLLSANLHKTFDKNHWTIDANKRIVILNNDSASIKKYNNKVIDIDDNTLYYIMLRNKKIDLYT